MSHSVDKPFQGLELSQRILASAGELAELVIVPPAKGSVQFLHAILNEDRPLTLRQLIEPCTSELLESVARRKAEAGVVLTGHPALLPLTWLSNRRVESGMTAGWETEFEQKTHISVGDERTVLKWAQQVFNECVAARLLATAEDQG